MSVLAIFRQHGPRLPSAEQDPSRDAIVVADVFSG